MTQLRAVLFDLDNTLIDWSNHSVDWHELRCSHLRPVLDRLAEAGHEVPPVEEVAEIYVSCNEEAWAASREPDWVAPRQLAVLGQTLRLVGIEIDEAELLDLQRLYAWSVIPGVEPYPDAISVLETLRAHGVRTGLVTNASSPMWMRDRELEHYGLLEYLDVRITAGDAGHLKPHPRAFQWVLGELGIRPEEAVMVGDQLHDDIGGAQRVGMRGVWIQRYEGDQYRESDGVKPDATIRQLSELLPCLDEWFPGWRSS